MRVTAKHTSNVVTRNSSPYESGWMETNSGNGNPEKKTPDKVAHSMGLPEMHEKFSDTGNQTMQQVSGL